MIVKNLLIATAISGPATAPRPFDLPRNEVNCMKNSLLIYLLLNISLLYIVAAILTEVRPSCASY